MILTPAYKKLRGNWHGMQILPERIDNAECKCEVPQPTSQRKDSTCQSKCFRCGNWVSDE